ncbi:MAG: FAD-dependent oxidoreductase [Bryobacteraceae bacterium]
MLGQTIKAILDSSNPAGRRPVVDANLESNVRGLFVIGDLSGAPVVKLAMEHGYRVANYIAALAGARGSEPGEYDVVVVGAGASGLNAALELQAKGLRVVVLEKNKIANTIEDFPEGKWVYAEPDATPPKGKLWLDGARKEDLLARWRQIVDENKLDVRTGEGVERAAKGRDGIFEVWTQNGVYRTRRVVLATGQRGTPRKLGVPGEDREGVYHRLYSPGHYRGEKILVVGGGNSAVEAALTLAERNRVTLSYRGSSFARVFKENERLIAEAQAAGRVEVVFESTVASFAERTYTLNTRSGQTEREYDHAFVLVGAEVPAAFLKSLGIRLENEWTGSPWWAILALAAAMTGLWLTGAKTGVAALGGLGWPGAAAAAGGIAAMIAMGVRGNRYSWLAFSFLVCYTIYGAKMGTGFEFWPYKGWGYKAFSFFDRPMSFWYTVAYTLAMTAFGFRAMKRWGVDRKDRFQIWRYTSLLAFQWIFFFLIPEFLFQYAVKYQWVGERLAADPVFAGQAWRSYGIVYAWPLFFYTFFGSPHQIWIVWGVILTFVLIPLLALWHGKRYCSWICGCGGLAETLGDRWRQNAPKGKSSIRWEWMNWAVLGAAAGITAMVLLKDTVELFRATHATALVWYRLVADVWLVGIVPVTLYPFLGGKIWCRYWCPLAKLMHIFSGVFTRFKASRFAIYSNDKCIACGECSRNCQVGIDVMSHALKQQVLDNGNSSCIGCGICVSVCPMDVLSFTRAGTAANLVQIQTTKAA